MDWRKYSVELQAVGCVDFQMLTFHIVSSERGIIFSCFSVKFPDMTRRHFICTHVQLCSNVGP